jgi:3'-5' exoribonuclease
MLATLGERMTSRINIAELRPKDELTNTFLVKFINVAEARDGKKYLNIIFTDGTGDLEARAWNNAEEIADVIEKNQFVRASGRLNLFQGRKQFIISEIQKIEQSEINLDDFVMKAKIHPEVMFKELMNIVDRLSDVYIKELLANILSDSEISRRLKSWQAGKSIHHAYRSGLLEHILSCSKLGLELSRHYEVNESYVVAGCILHDLCKIYELTDGLSVDYTEEGKLVGHLVKGLEIVDRFAYKIENFPYNVKMHLKHILLAHHGEYEYGSPKIPQTQEAYLVHLIDLMDSKMNAMEMIKRTDQQSGHWSNFVKHLDRIVYKDDLPTFSEKIESPHQHKEPKVKAPVETKKGQPELKQNLAKLLGGVKLPES